MLTADASYHALTHLTRLAQRREHALAVLKRALDGRLEVLAESALDVAVETGDPIGMVLAGQVERTASVDLAERLMERCRGPWYRGSVPLREVALAATRATIDVHRTRAAELDEGWRSELALLLNDLGIRLSDLGRHEAAHEATCEAITHYRQLSESRPEGYLPHLARALSNQSVDLSALGRGEEALAAVREAVDIRRELSRSAPVPSSRNLPRVSTTWAKC